jgi:hypothetical protein
VHTVVEHPSSTLGSAKVGTSFSCSISVPRELSHNLASKDQSSAGNSDCSKKEELVLPTDSKHDSAKFSEDSSQEVRKCSELRASDLAAPLSDEQVQSTEGATLPSSSWYADASSNWSYF